MTGKFDVNFFKPFTDGTLHTLKVQCRTEATPGRVFMKGKGPTLDAELIAVISLSSSGFCGTISLVFPKETFLGLMRNMLDEQFREITAELQDGAAELLNMIFGHAKRVLNTQGHDILKAIPSLIRGKDLQSTPLSHDPVVVLQFLSTEGEFHIEICSQTSLQ